MYRDFTDTRLPSLGIPPVVMTKQCHSEFPIIVSFLQPTFSGKSSPSSRNPLCLSKSMVWTGMLREKITRNYTSIFYKNKSNNSNNDSNSNIDINNDNDNTGGSSPSRRNPLCLPKTLVWTSMLERKSIAITLVFHIIIITITWPSSVTILLRPEDLNIHELQKLTLLSTAHPLRRDFFIK